MSLICKLEKLYVYDIILKNRRLIQKSFLSLKCDKKVISLQIRNILRVSHAHWNAFYNYEEGKGNINQEIVK